MNYTQYILALLCVVPLLVEAGAVQYEQKSLFISLPHNIIGAFTYTKDFRNGDYHNLAFSLTAIRPDLVISQPFSAQYQLFSNNQNRNDKTSTSMINRVVQSCSEYGCKSVNCQTKDDCANDVTAQVVSTITQFGLSVSYEHNSTINTDLFDIQPTNIDKQIADAQKADKQIEQEKLKLKRIASIAALTATGLCFATYCAYRTGFFNRWISQRA